MKKKLVSVFLVVALVAIAAMGTLAYFTDSDEVSNTFTVGKVGIDLYETKDGKTIQDGIDYVKAIVPGTVFEKDPTVAIDKDSQESYLFLDLSINKHKSLFPVMAQDAVAQGILDPGVVTACMVNDSFSTKTFLAKMAEDPATFRAIMDRWFTGITHEEWQICGFFYDTDDEDLTAEGKYLTIRFAYTGTLAGGCQPIQFMSAFQMPKTVTSEMVSNEGYVSNPFNSDSEEFHMNFKAYAIQAAELPTVDHAFNALFTDLGSFYTPITVPAP